SSPMNPFLSLNTAPYAALLGLLGAALTINVILNRVRSGINAGDGGVPALAQAIRAHANFVEQAPIALIVLGLAEVSGARMLFVNVLGVALIAARLASAYALNHTLAQTPLRQFGGGVSVLILAAAACADLLMTRGAGRPRRSRLALPIVAIFNSMSRGGLGDR